MREGERIDFRLPLAAALSIGLYHLTPLLPPVGMVAVAPLYYAFVVHGLVAGWGVLGAGALFALFVGGGAHAYSYVAVIGGVAWLLAHGFRSGLPVPVVALRATAIPWGMLAFGLFGAALATGTSVSALLVGWADAVITRTAATYEETGADPAFTVWLADARPAVVDFFAASLPALVFVTLLFAVVVNMMVIRAWSLKTGAGIHFTYPFGALRAPDELVWGLIVGGFGWYLVDGPGGDMGLNLFIIALAVYFLQGIAIAHYFFGKWNAPILLRAFGYFMIFSHPLFMALTSGLGLADVWFSFRVDGEGEAKGGDAS